MDLSGNILLDIYARPNEPITDYRTRWSGLRRKDLIKAVPVESAVNIIKRTLKVSGLCFCVLLKGNYEERKPKLCTKMSL